MFGSSKKLNEADIVVTTSGRVLKTRDPNIRVLVVRDRSEGPVAVPILAKGSKVNS